MLKEEFLITNPVSKSATDSGVTGKSRKTLLADKNLAEQKWLNDAGYGWCSMYSQVPASS